MKIKKMMKVAFLLSSFVFLLTIITACTNDGVFNSDKEKMESGRIKIDGSSTVFPIMEAVSEEFRLKYPKVEAPVGISGTGGGFEKFVKGETDISNASRPMKKKEKKAAKENKINYTSFELAYDGLSVVVNKDNHFINHLTIDELKKIFLEKNKAKTWADVRKGWPNRKIEVFSPGTDSGTYDYFDDVILQGKPLRRDAELSENDNILVQGVSGSKYAIGFFGFAYYAANKDKLKAVPIDGGRGPVEPDAETIKSGKYSPLSRPLFTYVNNQSLKTNKAVYDYIEFTLKNAGRLASSDDIGYVALPDENYKKQLKILNELVKK
ncbi:PstS family phosphate ABC transporter substrate-binding protein [Fictibacillus sp. Mic-4]|uniref:PstS family phosphate ABC transporter substrate-binding protein n=1 Tax=Fictibacillus sp. Mic-4 TaxID=3132826 RepID=UPI003CEE3D2B